jgi:choline dehydrogenase-like flavoprotein
VYLDARNIPDQSVIETDVCIVGAGAAGIALALEFRQRSFRVTLLESGGLRMDEPTQALQRGERAGHPAPALDDTRLTGFGGTTSVWAGACRPLDEVDLEPRDWVPHSGWPLSRAELDPYYARAQAICQLGPFAYDVRDWQTPDRRPLPFDPTRIRTDIFQLSPPTRFGVTYRADVLRAPNITTHLFANAVELETDESGATATGVRIVTLAGNRYRIKARVFIVAAGGIETPRLLLVSNSRYPAGLGNGNDLVGRFFIDHLRLESGKLRLHDPKRHGGLYRVHVPGACPSLPPIEGVLALAEGLTKSERLARAAFQFPPHWRATREFFGPGVTNLNHLARALRMRDVPYRWLPRLAIVVRHIDQVTLTMGRRLAQSIHTSDDLAVTCFGEQVPNPDSRVVLSSARDALGRPQARLEWRLSELDLYTLRRASELLAAETTCAGVGHFIPAPWLLSSSDLPTPRGGFHHLGTTRMHDDPARGVVDADCRLHEVSNVYVAGGSIFPTGGYANPTLTVVALAIRLADHLRAQLTAAPANVSLAQARG